MKNKFTKYECVEGHTFYISGQPFEILTCPICEQPTIAIESCDLKKKKTKPIKPSFVKCVK